MYGTKEYIRRPFSILSLCLSPPFSNMLEIEPGFEAKLLIQLEYEYLCRVPYRPYLDDIKMCYLYYYTFMTS